MPHRTPRTRALEIGTDASKFGPEIPYSPKDGHPTGEGMPSGTYNDPGDEAAPNAGTKVPSKRPF